VEIRERGPSGPFLFRDLTELALERRRIAFPKAQDKAL